MVQFHETVMGKRFFENTLPSMVDEIHKLKVSNEQMAQALLEEIHKLNENLRPKEVERTVAIADNLGVFLSEGWRPILTFRDHRDGCDCIVIEREVQDVHR